MRTEDNIQIEGIMAFIDRDNIDTDQIIPTEYLKSIKKFGYEDYLFDGWRYLDEGKLGVPKTSRKLNNEFILNQPIFMTSKILLARDNFGCGSSREHAVWALRDFGIQVIIASSFGDIFYNNCFKNGLLPINLSKSLIDRLFQLSAQDAQLVKVCLQSRNIYVQGEEFSFNLEDDLADRIINQFDDIDISLKFADKISCFEQDRITKRPWIFYNE